ncbi:DUF1549 and DUF1553 domain-containing protein [Brevifollis gellanilyticus]|uniref:DUF1553 domain-containing protein n=1 Tax=Brevifollis gellanilyticus TaxID=748831 RepID=A0A512M3L6_9BACT|nr:DUF1549 and DUF1553 domain-containing protein [Brevifollis gellanilyticus]GEP41330.1 hypothetical protein BGE01nite_06210 [Brevifollis gellanilyticus]
MAASSRLSLTPVLLALLGVVAQPCAASEEKAPAGPHWAFIAPVKPEGARSIDQLLAKARREHGLVPQAPVEPSLWLRRVYLDLAGLPPTLEELKAFSASDSPATRRRIIDQLLSSPHHGERWGRHLMDVWRYSDWYGLGAQLRYSQKHMWHWRDWIVESLNEDKGYDVMVQQMLAGDEIAPEDPQVLRATGFLARNYYLFNRTTWLDDVIEHTSKAFLGLTMNCVKCHTHKYDPIQHEEYYAMRAIFEPYHVRLDALPGQSDLEKDGLPRAYDLHLDRVTNIHLKGDEKNLDTSHAVVPAVPAAIAFRPLEIVPVKLSPTAAQSQRGKAKVPVGDAKKKETREVSSLKALDGPDETEKTRFLPFPVQSTGRRSAFAKWITDRQNPLTARVIVNHLWLRHFGQALSANVFDFGRQAKKPPLQDVLDFLAIELMENGWSLKHIHRLIVTSDAYAMSSSNAQAADVNRERDKENEYLWRMNPVRLDAQILRDSLLHLSGTLDPRLGGPTLDPTTGEKLRRRSLYFNQTRDESNLFLEMFDNANVLDCYRRAESIVPQQALALMNAQTSLSSAAIIAKHFHQPEDEAFVRTAFEALLATAPNQEEVQICLEALHELGTGEKARTAFIHTLLNHHDFITVR